MNNTCDKDNDLRFVWTVKTAESISMEFELIPNGKEIVVDDSNKQQFLTHL